MAIIDQKITIYEILTDSNITKSINDNINTLLNIIPEIKPMIGFDQKHPHHHLDVWNHTILAISMSPNDFEIRLSLLLHDIGKPFSYTEEDNIRHFKNHANVSAKIAKDILNRLNFDDNYITKICYLIINHDEKITEEDIKKNYELTYQRYIIQTCDALAHHPNKLEKRKQYILNIKEKLNKVKTKNR